MRKLSACSFLLLALAACSSSSSSSSSNDAGSSDAADDAPVAAANNCVPKGYKGNNVGVGAFCDSTTSCPDSTKFLVCTAFHDAPPTEYFCTTPCTADGDCGDNAFCVHDPAGSGCVPAQCGGKSDSDGGANDGASDSPSSG
jgi:hypothetical protein